MLMNPSVLDLGISRNHIGLTKKHESASYSLRRNAKKIIVYADQIM